MRNSIFVKAEKLKDKVTFEGSGRNLEWYSIKEVENPPSISLSCDGKGTEMTCTCKSCSIHTHKYLCSYKIAVLKALPLKK